MFHAWYSEKERQLRGASVYLDGNKKQVLATCVCTEKEYVGQGEFDDEVYVGEVQEHVIGFVPRKVDTLDESNTKIVLNSKTLCFNDEEKTIGEFYRTYGSCDKAASPTSAWVMQHCREMGIEVTFKFERKQVGYFSPSAFASRGGAVYNSKSGYPVVCTNVCPTKECGDKSVYGEADDVYVGEVVDFVCRIR